MVQLSAEILCSVRPMKYPQRDETMGTEFAEPPTIRVACKQTGDRFEREIPPLRLIGFLSALILKCPSGTNQVIVFR